MRLFLDANVAKSVGAVFKEAGHEVLFAQEELGDGAPDIVVCTAAKANNCILVAHDKDMKALSKQNRFRTLNFIMLYCGNVLATKRVAFMMSLIEHEFGKSDEKKARRLFLEIHKHTIRSHR